MTMPFYQVMLLCIAFLQVMLLLIWLLASNAIVDLFVQVMLFGI